MTSIESITLEAPDPAAAGRFYTAAFGLGTQLRLRASKAPTAGFRGFTISLTVSQPATVKGPIGAALDAGATPLKPATKQFWAATPASCKPRTGPSGRSRPRRRRTPDRPPGRSTRSCCWAPRTWPRANGSTPTAALPWRMPMAASSSRSPLHPMPSSWRSTGDAAARDAGVSPDGTGSHRLMIGSDAGPFTGLDGFAWDTAPL